MRALLRRSFQRSQPLIVHGDVSLDPASHEVSYQGLPVVLQRKEYLLLHQMLCQPGKVHTRDKLVQVLYGWNEEVESNALDVHIHHLRKKLHPDLIRTVRGVGYIVDKAP
jgi:two-component system response regulator QseB